MNNKILILGKGYMGLRLQEAYNCQITDQRINCYQDIVDVLEKFKPDTIINCIGYTGKNNVDDCEKDIQNTLNANTFVPILLAEATLRNNIKYVHLSSGCIYDYDYANNQAPITESEAAKFFGLFYSRTKIYTERVLDHLADQYGILIVRIRIPLDNRPHPKNIINKLLKYGKVLDVPNSVTYVPDFIQWLDHLIKINAKGIFNTVNKTPLRYPDLMDAYKKRMPDFNYEILPLENLGLVRTNIILSTDKLEQSGCHVRKIEEVLEECVENYLNYSSPVEQAS